MVLIPAGKVALGKLAQTVAYGARILAVRGDFDACLDLVDRGGAALGLYLVNSINPFRLEGQKAIVFELLDQLGWDPPDWIVLPAGNLGNTSAFGKALAEARAVGIDRPAAADRRDPGERSGSLSPGASPKDSPPATGSRRTRWRPRSGSAIRRPSTGRSTPSGSPTGW